MTCLSLNLLLVRYLPGRLNILWVATCLNLGPNLRRHTTGTGTTLNQHGGRGCLMDTVACDVDDLNRNL